MRKIPLTKGKFTLVDDSDYRWLHQYKWYCAHGYAVRTVYDRFDKKKPYQLRMHRVIIEPSEGFDVDHINGNKLDNRRSNLREATRSQNIANQFAKKQNNSGYKGVSWKKANNKWCAQISFKNKVYHIGLFVEKEGAARAYNKEAKKLFGEFAYLNVIEKNKSWIK